MNEKTTWTARESEARKEVGNSSRAPNARAGGEIGGLFESQKAYFERRYYKSHRRNLEVTVLCIHKWRRAEESNPPCYEHGLTGMYRPVQRHADALHKIRGSEGLTST
jgi:hypothetical protein